MNESVQITLKDGRKLGYVRYGKADGPPVFYNHGWPGSRFEAQLLQSAAEAVGVDLIAIDRPGYGLSDFQPGRTFLDWPDDLADLADQLGHPKFYVLGLSGGGPYAASAAYKIPERLQGATIIAGLSPMSNPRTREGMRPLNIFLLSWAPRIPGLLNLMMRVTHSVIQNPKAFERSMADLPEVDREVIKGKKGLAHVAKEAYKQGVRGTTHDGVLYSRGWGFELGEISMPLTIWQGTLDVNVPQSNGQILAEEIPNGTLNLIEGEGHLSVVVNYGEAILRDLIDGND
ncbi:MAG: alpha/beta hydrolase [Chloroflexota bacterium]